VRKNEWIIEIDDQKTSECLIIHGDGGIEKDMILKIKGGWSKRRSSYKFYVFMEYSWNKLKKRFCKTTIKPAMLYVWFRVSHN